MKNSIKNLRKQIDGYDDEIMRLISERVRIGKKVVSMKKELKLGKDDTPREDQILKRSDNYGEESELLREIYRRIFSWVKEDKSEKH